MTNVPARPRVLPPIWFLLALALMVALHWALPIPRVIPEPWNWLGLLPLAGGLALASWAALLFRRAGTGVRPGSSPTALVERGPYRFTRNPMYLGLTTALIGVAVLLGTFPPLLVVPLFATVIDRRFVVAEEAALDAAFGEAYRRYRSGVRRWV